MMVLDKITGERFSQEEFEALERGRKIILEREIVEKGGHVQGRNCGISSITQRLEPYLGGIPYSDAIHLIGLRFSKGGKVISNFPEFDTKPNPEIDLTDPFCLNDGLVEMENLETLMPYEREALKSEAWAEKCLEFEFPEFGKPVMRWIGRVDRDKEKGTRGK